MKRAMALAALAASMFLVMAAAPAPVGAVVGAVQEFPVTPTGGGGLNRITSGPDGKVWFTAPGANSIGRINADGTGLALFPIPTADSSPIDITTGPDGNLWFTEFVGTVGKITTAGAITEYRVPPLRPNGTVNKNDRAFAFGITSGPDGALWFILNCCSGGDQHVRSAIGRITTAGAITQYDVPAGTTPAVGITTGPDGNLWYPATNIPCGNKNLPCSQRLDGRIQRMTPTGVVTGDFLIPTPYSDPSRIVTGPDGNLWFTEQGAIGANGCCEPTFPAQGKIGRLTPSTGAIAEFPTLPNSEGSFYTNPAGIAAGPDGNIWWTEYSYTTRPRNAEPGGLLHGGNRIGRINPTTFAVTEFPVPTAGARADGITNGPPGSNALFFTESPNNFQLSAVGKISAT